jgi:hypothetical protein
MKPVALFKQRLKLTNHPLYPAVNISHCVRVRLHRL